MNDSEGWAPCSHLPCCTVLGNDNVSRKRCSYKLWQWRNMEFGLHFLGFTTSSSQDLRMRSTVATEDGACVWDATESPWRHSISILVCSQAPAACQGNTTY
ncbi:hypothetical protein MHYP_G00324900 [Metynnis hypsauchen]